MISVRRLSYLHTILNRQEGGLIKQIYIAMKDKPLKLDWITLVQKAMDRFEIDLTDEQISLIPYKEFKNLIKNKVRIQVFKDLTEIKLNHS